MASYDILRMSFNALEQLEFVLRIFVACVLGYSIGYERKSRDKSAGMRTHAIVAMGAAVFMIVSKYGFRDIPDYDASRVAAQVVSGIGFLGAGVIFVRNNSVSGLTTAAGLWVTVGVGMAVGAGSYFIGICSGVMMIILQIALHRIRFLASEPLRGYLKMTTVDDHAVLTDIQNDFINQKIRIEDIKISKSKRKGEMKMEFILIYPPNVEKNDIILNWSQDERITAIAG